MQLEHCTQDSMYIGLCYHLDASCYACLAQISMVGPWCNQGIVISYEMGSVQVGWRRSGLAVWSASGCRLMCSLRQTARPNTFTPLSSASSSAFASDGHKQNALPMEVSQTVVMLGQISNSQHGALCAG